MTPDAKGAVLLWLAHGALGGAFGGPHVVPGPEPWLAERAATFVTLRKFGKLRGCVGSVWPTRAVGDDVIHTARRAAFADARFDPVRREELDELDIGVSVLSTLSPLPIMDEEDARTSLVPRRDGVHLSCGPLRAVFLPKVWEILPEPTEFLACLKRKAGLPAEYWSEHIRLHTFTAEEFADPPHQDATNRLESMQ